MISRRSVLGTGAGIVVVAGGLAAAHLTHRLDDVADAVGLDPLPEPDPADQRLLASAAASQGALLATVRATAAQHPDLPLTDVEPIGVEHVDALGGGTGTAAAVPAEQAAAVAALAAAYTEAAATRATDATAAVSPALARVLASMSAGLTQCAQRVGALA